MFRIGRPRTAGLAVGGGRNNRGGARQSLRGRRAQPGRDLAGHRRPDGQCADQRRPLGTGVGVRCGSDLAPPGGVAGVPGRMDGRAADSARNRARWRFRRPAGKCSLRRGRFGRPAWPVAHGRQGGGRHRGHAGAQRPPCGRFTAHHQRVRFPRRPPDFSQQYVPCFPVAAAPCRARTRATVGSGRPDKVRGSDPQCRIRQPRAHWAASGSRPAMAANVATRCSPPRRDPVP